MRKMTNTTQCQEPGDDLLILKMCSMLQWKQGHRGCKEAVGDPKALLQQCSKSRAMAEEEVGWSLTPFFSANTAISETRQNRMIDG